MNGWSTQKITVVPNAKVKIQYNRTSLFHVISIPRFVGGEQSVVIRSFAGLVLAGWGSYGFAFSRFEIENGDLA